MSSKNYTTFYYYLEQHLKSPTKFQRGRAFELRHSTNPFLPIYIWAEIEAVTGTTRKTMKTLFSRWAKLHL